MSNKNEKSPWFQTKIYEVQRKTEVNHSITLKLRTSLKTKYHKLRKRKKTETNKTITNLEAPIPQGTEGNKEQKKDRSSHTNLRAYHLYGNELISTVHNTFVRTLQENKNLTPPKMRKIHRQKLPQRRNPN